MPFHSLARGVGSAVTHEPRSNLCRRSARPSAKLRRPPRRRRGLSANIRVGTVDADGPTFCADREAARRDMRTDACPSHGADCLHGAAPARGPGGRRTPNATVGFWFVG